MRRGDVYDADRDPVRGSEQAGVRPVIVVSRDAISNASSVIIVVPFTSARLGRRLYPSQVLVRAPEGGLDNDSVALGEQVRAISKSRLRRHRGAIAAATLVQIDRALINALDLPCP